MIEITPSPPYCPLNGNPTGLVSLYAVLEFSANDFCQAVSILAQYRQQIHAGLIPAKSTYGLLGGEMGVLERHCKALGLNTTVAQIVRVKEMFAGQNSYSYDRRTLADSMMEVCVRLIDELEARKVYIVSAERNAYVTGNNFSTLVGQRFPDAIADMDEAARCFAFERPTACIFHLMRITEYAIHEISGHLGMTDHNPTWEPIIRKIDSEMKSKYSARKFKGSQELLANMSTHLHAVKVAWRNKTMHVEKINTMEHAKEIYDATAGLMRYLSENLPAKKIGVIQSIRGSLGV